MAWKEDLQDASFRGVPFECISIKDAVSKTQAVHQAPYANDALIEDMGKDPRKITVQAIYTGRDYKTWLDALEGALEQTGSGELIHPIYGLCHASVMSYGIDHDADNVDACMISIDFILGKDQERSLFVPVQTVEELNTDSILQAPIEALETKLEQIKEKDPNLFFSIINQIKDYVNTARNMLGLAKKTFEDWVSPAKCLVELVDEISRLVHFDTSISAISKWRDLIKRVERFGKAGQKKEESVPELKKVYRALQVASIVEVTQAVVAQTRKEMRESTPISLTPIDLAIIRQQNRNVLQDAIRSERDEVTEVMSLLPITQIQVYKDIADQIHTQIQSLIEIRPPITKVIVDVSCTLHWLAHRLYGDFKRADEIRRLNPNLNNPAILQSGMELTVYAR